MTYLDVGWMCGGVVHSFCTAAKQLSEPKKCRQDYLMSSAQLLYGPCLQLVLHLHACSFSGNVPLLYTSTQRPGTSLYVISFTRPSPALGKGKGNSSVGHTSLSPKLLYVRNQVRSTVKSGQLASLPGSF